MDVPVGFITASRALFFAGAVAAAFFFAAGVFLVVAIMLGLVSVLKYLQFSVIYFVPDCNKFHSQKAYLMNECLELRIFA